MCHVHHEVASIDVCNLAQTFVVPVSWVGRGTADQQAGFEETSLFLKEIVVNQTGLRVDLIRERLEIDG